MSGFTKLNPTMKLSLDNIEHFVLTDPEFYYFPPAYIGYYRIVVKPDVPMETDLASIPRMFRSLFPRHGRYTPAALIHDWLYKWAVFIIAMGGVPPYTKLQADQIFLAGMEDLKVSRWTRYIFYTSLRLSRDWKVKVNAKT